MLSESLYINNVDECVNNIIDSLYLELIEEKSIKKKLESNDYMLNKFDQILDKINLIIKSNTKQFNIMDIITNPDSMNRIMNLFNNYVLLYLFFNQGLKNGLEDMLNIINKLSKKYQIDFFHNQYLTQYSMYLEYIINFKYALLNAKIMDNKIIFDQKTLTNIDVMQSLNAINIEVLINIINHKEDLTHNVLKIIIFREIYMKEDKLMIFQILENEELASAEFKYIEIIDSKYDTIDYGVIESLFSSSDIKSGLAEEIYQMITDYETSKFNNDLTSEMKINHLFKKKILIPITDEFLRYHKDTELYDKNIGTKIDPKQRVNKKDNTKIRYIVTKVNKIKDYYSTKIRSDKTQLEEIERYFYQPMMYRKAIIINDLEEINILRKLELQGKSVTDSNEYYEEIKQMRTYPFIEFKHTPVDSFSFNPLESTTSIRYCNFEYKSDPKYPNIGKTELQYRTINNHTKANIVGVAIPRFNLIHTNNINRQNQTIIPCHTVNQTLDMAILNKNSFIVALKKLRKLFLTNKSYSKILYWIFNKKNDTIKLELFDNVKQLPTDEYIKLLLSKIYDEMVHITYELAIAELDKFEHVEIKTAMEILTNLESKLVIIPKQSIEYAELMKLIYYIKAEVNESTYDTSEDIIPGTNNKLIKLPRVLLEKVTLHVINISKTELVKSMADDIDQYEGYMCQHTITWTNIMKFKKSNPNKFNQELFNFIKKYVVENSDSDFVCKSCYQLVDLRKYTTEIYPGSDSIAISYGLETELETIPDYVKYTKSIKNMDKLIEKTAYSSNITYFVGSAQQTKYRRQEIIKNIIDLIGIQYQILYSKDTAVRKERLDKSIKNYGCQMTNFFLFKLENDIFTYSSKETDKFKLFKMNNILTYIMISIIIELNLSQILYLTFDKLVNYFLFTKFGFGLFDNLYIRISNSNDVVPIKNYKLLCYVIYYITGIYAKFNMWFAENMPSKPNNINPQIQRLAIHTFIDCLNSILEVNSKSEKNYLYSIFATKFFNKLNSVYSNIASKEVIDQLESINKKKVIISSDNKLKYSVSIVDTIPLHPYDSNGQFIIESTLGTRPKITSYPSLKYVNEKFNEKDRIETLGDDFSKVSNKLYMESLIKIASIYDSNGVKRNTQITLSEAEKISLNELKKISLAVKNTRLSGQIQSKKRLDKKLEKINMQLIHNEEYINKLRTMFNVDIDDIINNFITKLESLIGKNININNNNIYLRTDTYEIDHDYRGNKKSSIFITDLDKIKFKKDDQYFKQDIYYYVDALNQVTVYYSAIEKYLIGYKENSRDYTKISNSDCYLKIHHSILNQLKLFGFNYINYKLGLKNSNLTTFVNNILRIRLQNLKNSLSDIQQIIYQIKNNFSGSNLNPIAKYYQSKIKSINTYDGDGERIFKDWNLINSSMFYNPMDIENIPIKILPNKIKYIQSVNLLKFITNDDIILYYIIEQLNMLLDINEETYTKVNLAYMIINIIMQIFRNFTNCENAFYDLNVKKFYHYISTKAEVSETHDEIDITTLSEEELEKLKEEHDIDREAADAIDADQDETNEDFGDEDVLLLDRVSGEY